MCGYFERKRCERDVKKIMEVMAAATDRMIELESIVATKDAEIAALKQERDKLLAENDALRQEVSDWRSAKYIAEQKETAVHLALNDMRKERDALLKVREAADALADAAEGYPCTTEYDPLYVTVKAYKEARVDRPVAMSEYSPPVGNSREHEFTTALADALGTVRGIPPGGDYTLGTVVYQAAEEIARLRRALCEYQLKYWTIQYKLSLFSIEGGA